MSYPGPLIAYVVACPSCGFIEMHQHLDARFIEDEGKLLRNEKAVQCLYCHRTISIADGVVTALLHGVQHAG